MKHVFHQFPQKPQFEQKYKFKSDLPYIVRIMAGMDGRFGTFITDGPDFKGRTIPAKRDINIEIVDKSTDFVYLNKNSLETVLKDITSEGTVDFRVTLKYSYLDKKFDRVPFKGDTFLVRANMENEVLTMKVHRIDGLGRTESGRIADTIVDEIIRNAPMSDLNV